MIYLLTYLRTRRHLPARANWTLGLGNKLRVQKQQANAAGPVETMRINCCVSTGWPIGNWLSGSGMMAWSVKVCRVRKVVCPIDCVGCCYGVVWL